MIELTRRISRKELRELRAKMRLLDPYLSADREGEISEASAQAQLEDDQEKVKAIVREMFEEIEGKLFEITPSKKLLIKVMATEGYDKWQALKQKYLKEVKDE